MSGALDTLAIDDDDLSFHVLPMVERSFRIAFDPSDLAQMHTVGDWYNLILRKTARRGGKRCATSMAFYRLRRAIGRHGAIALTPDLRLDRCGQSSPKRLRAILGVDTGLGMPDIYGGTAAVIGIVMIAVAVPVFSLLNAWVGVGAAGLGILAIRSDGGRWTSDWTSLGTLSRSVAFLNHATLVDGGARDGEVETWNVLVGLLEGYSSRHGVIKRKTRLLA